jgi:hypothetical protein
LTSLLEMGFDDPTAGKAADAAACDVSMAAALLMEGRLFGGVKPVSVTGCVIVVGLSLVCCQGALTAEGWARGV